MITEPGIYPDVPFSKYLQMPILSQSTLKEGRASMAHLRAALDGERKKKVTDTMNCGSALHVACLEPELMPAKVVMWDKGTRRGKVWDDFSLEHAGKIILTEDMYESMTGMVKSLRRHKVMRDWTKKMEATEVVAVGNVQGVMMKGRCDALTADPLIDLKATRSTDLRAMTNTVMTFGYDIQAAIYRELFNRDRFILLCVEDSPPHDVVAFELSPAFLRRGLTEAASLIQQYKFCLERNEWPGRAPDEIVQLEVPEWAEPDEGDAITLDGQPAFTEEEQ